MIRDVILIEPDDNTNVAKLRWLTEDKSTNVDKYRWSIEDILENNTCIVKSRWSGEEHMNSLEPEGELEDACALTISEGPMTCARSKKFKEAVLLGQFGNKWKAMFKVSSMIS